MDIIAESFFTSLEGIVPQARIDELRTAFRPGRSPQHVRDALQKLSAELRGAPEPKSAPTELELARRWAALPDNLSRRCWIDRTVRRD